MKTFQKTVLALGAVLFVVVLAGCGAKKKAKNQPVVNAGEVELIVPCSGPEYQSDNKNFRASAIGESLDQMAAKKIALSNARSFIASDVAAVMKIVGDNYVKNSDLNNATEFMGRFEENARTVVNQQLNGTRVICEKVTQVASTGAYKYYIAVEMSAEKIRDSFDQSMSSDESLKVDFNYERFKKVFEQEMENYAKSR